MVGASPTGVNSRSYNNVAFETYSWPLFPALHDLVDQSVGDRLVGGENAVTLAVGVDLLLRSPGVESEDLVEARAHAEEVERVNGDVGLLPAQAAHPRLVDEHATVGQARALALGAAGKEHRGERAGLPHAQRGHVGFHVLHGVVDGEAAGDRAARRVDVELDVL